MENKPQKVHFDISLSMIWKILGVVLGLIFLYLVRDILLILFIAFIIASAITPLVDKLEDRKIPRVLSLIGVYIILLGVIVLVVMLIIPPVTTQLGQLASNIPYYYQEVSGWLANADASSQAALGLQDMLQNWTSNLGQGVSGIFSFLGSFMGVMVGAFLSLVIAFYMSLQKDSVKKFVRSVTPKKYQPYAIQLTRRIQEKMGAWITGQLVLCLVIGVLAYVSLLIMGIKYALVLALFAGMTEIIPYIGPWIGAVPAVFLGFLQSPVLGLIVLIVYIVVIQQLENSVVVPVVMKKAVGLNPIITIIAIAIGGQLAGVAGAIIAIPLAVVISIVLKDIVEFNKEVEKI